ncbi:MAG: lactate utilization protein [Gammaproteobacteria bacterium]|nr:lactate utilization protein [Gammaproteobacteria bacterium]
MKWLLKKDTTVSNARENILQCLEQNTLSDKLDVPIYLSDYNWSLEQKIENFSEHIQSVHAEVHRSKAKDWKDCLFSILQQKSVTKLLTGTDAGLIKELTANTPDTLQLIEYKQSIEDWKTELFGHIYAGITTTVGAIAETGSIILWPSIQEPRLISLVPPIHIALVDVNCIYETFGQAIQEQKWAKDMPTNALLISGPSKTADIEQVLAYGVHGPKELIIIIYE